ncbi:MAG: response regulator [Burkholderiales bacterium]|nr:response regulator [Burkholderiales bacterium]
MRALKGIYVALAQRILVIEDEVVLARNVKIFLERRFPDVRVAASGRCAIKLLDSFSPDVLVLDFHLPGQTGLQIYAEIMRHRESPINCIMVTGYPLEHIGPSARALGIRYLLGKPFKLGDLQCLIDRSSEERPAPGIERRRTAKALLPQSGVYN